MLNKRELKQLKRLEVMRQMESHRPLVVKSLNKQIRDFKSRSSKR